MVLLVEVVEMGEGVVRTPEVQLSVFVLDGLQVRALVQRTVAVGNIDPIPVVEGVLGVGAKVADRIKRSLPRVFATAA